jgi:hypothetical protein
MAKSMFEGRYCPFCGAPLKVVSTEPSLTGTFEGEPIVASVYVCEGESQHQWEDRATFFGGRVMSIALRGVEVVD